MKNRLWGLVAAGLLASPMAANAGLIDFSATPGGNFASYSEQGVTFTPLGGSLTSTVFGNTPNGTRGLIAYVNSNDFRAIRADISGGASAVSIDLGDRLGDSDTLFLEIFNAANVLLGSRTELIDSSFAGMRTLSLSALDISYAVFGSRSPSLAGSSVYADNFAFTARTAVPEPGTLMLLGLGLAGLGIARRRKEA